MMLSKTRFKVNSNKYINKNVQVVLHGVSSHMKVIRLVKMLLLRRTLKAQSLYRQGETPKAKDIVDGPKDGAKTEAQCQSSR